MNRSGASLPARSVAAVAWTAAALAAFGACNWMRNEQPVPPVVTLGTKVLGVVHFPEFWTTAHPVGEPALRPGERRLLSPGMFEVRQRASQPIEELMFGVRSTEGSVSENHYAVSTDGSFRVRAAVDQEWKDAERVLVRQEETVQEARWQGKAFRHTGASLGRAILSPDETMMTLLSITETERPRGLGPMILPAAGKYRGTSYLDLYDTSSGEELAAAQVPYVGVDGAIVFRFAAWIESRAFIVPLDLQAQTMMIAVRPAR